MTDQLICRSCGRSFTLSDDVAARYPGWTPKECPACYRDARGGGRGGGRGRGVGAASVPAGGKRAARHAREENLSLADVLERYTEGPDDGVFTDGSANPNPGPGGWGAVYVADGEVRAQAHGHEPATTNNRMELTALIEGARLVPPGTPTQVYTDSKLCVDTITQWAAGWERRGWKRKTGPVENLDLVKEAYRVFQDRPELELVWIKAHAGNRWNEYADSLSTAYSRDEL
jgi:ribonuclease HI